MSAPIFEMAAVLAIIERAGTDGISIEEMRKDSTGGINFESAIAHLKDDGSIRRIPQTGRYSANTCKTSLAQRLDLSL